MSILDRLNLLVRSNLNDMGPRSSYQNTMRDMESSLRDARKQLATLRQNERQLVDQLRAKSEKIDQWEERAIMALKNDSEDLAREAIMVKNETMREAERLREQLHSHRAYMQDMESSLEALQVKLDAARSRHSIDQRDSAPRDSSYPPRSAPASDRRNESDWDAELRRRLAERQNSQQGYTPQVASQRPYMENSPFDTDTSFETMERMARSIAEMEARVDAAQELSPDDPLIDPRRRELDRIFDRMEKDKRTGDDLSDLKRKFADD